MLPPFVYKFFYLSYSGAKKLRKQPSTYQSIYRRIIYKFSFSKTKSIAYDLILQTTTCLTAHECQLHGYVSLWSLVLQGTNKILCEYFIFLASGMVKFSKHFLLKMHIKIKRIKKRKRKIIKKRKKRNKISPKIKFLLITFLFSFFLEFVHWFACLFTGL